jgi:membrane protein DedA with SNARE-associated domain
MAVESVYPVPSEIIMPLAGWFLVEDRGHGLSISCSPVSTAPRNLLRSLVAYYVGRGGRPFLSVRPLGPDHTAEIDRRPLVRRYGEITVLASRMLPVIVLSSACLQA